jgi:hypothetical protein
MSRFVMIRRDLLMSAAELIRRSDVSESRVKRGVAVALGVAAFGVLALAGTLVAMASGGAAGEGGALAGYVLLLALGLVGAGVGATVTTLWSAYVQRYVLERQARSETSEVVEEVRDVVLAASRVWADEAFYAHVLGLVRGELRARSAALATSFSLEDLERVVLGAGLRTRISRAAVERLVSSSPTSSRILEDIKADDEDETPVGDGQADAS